MNDSSKGVLVRERVESEEEDGDGVKKVRERKKEKEKRERKEGGCGGKVLWVRVRPTTD